MILVKTAMAYTRDFDRLRDEIRDSAREDIHECERLGDGKRGAAAYISDLLVRRVEFQPDGLLSPLGSDGAELLAEYLGLRTGVPVRRDIDGAQSVVYLVAYMADPPTLELIRDEAQKLRSAGHQGAILAVAAALPYEGDPAELEHIVCTESDFCPFVDVKIEESPAVVQQELRARLERVLSRLAYWKDEARGAQGHSRALQQQLDNARSVARTIKVNLNAERSAHAATKAAAQQRIAELEAALGGAQESSAASWAYAQGERQLRGRWSEAAETLAGQLRAFAEAVRP